MTVAVEVFKGSADCCEDAAFPGSNIFFVYGHYYVDRVEVEVSTDLGILDCRLLDFEKEFVRCAGFSYFETTFEKDERTSHCTARDDYFFRFHYHFSHDFS